MQKRAGLSSVLTALPGIGGAAHALIDPVEGSPRGTSLFYEGSGGLLGSLLGGTAGALLMRDEFGRASLPGLAGGGVLGGIGGSLLGRWLASTKEDPDIEKLRKLLEKLSERGALSNTTAAGGITINVGPTEAQEVSNA